MTSEEIPRRSASAPPPSFTFGGGQGGDQQQQALMDKYVRNALCPTTTTTTHKNPPTTPRGGPAAATTGDPSAYAFVISQLRAASTKPKVLAGWLRALAASASMLTAERSRELLSAVFRIDFSADVGVQDAFLSLVVELSTSHSTYVPQMLRAMLFHLNPKRASSGAVYDSERSERVSRGVVETVREIVRLVPLSSAAVWQTFVDMYPHRRHDVVTQQSWLSAATQVCTFAPGIREPIIGAVISRLLQMDVEVRVEDEDAAQADLFFRLEIDPKKQHEPATTAAAAAASSVQDEESNVELCTKLDALMDAMFVFFDERLAETSPDRDADFSILLDHFVRYVLPTYRSKATQFLVFRAASHSPAYVDRLVGTLLRIVREEAGAQEDGSTASTAAPMVTRVAACAYVSSFLARANFVSVAVLGAALRDLLAFSQSYATAVVQRHAAILAQHQRQRQFASCSSQVSSTPPSSLVIDPSVHQLFYAAVQGALYVFCYAHSRLVYSAKSQGLEPHQFLSSLGFEPVLSCPLVPLRVCNSSVVQEFELLWRRYTGEPAAPPPRSTSPQFFVRTQAQSCAYTLEAFFPFDPYILRTSARHVDPLYTTWDSTHKGKLDEEEDEHDDAEEEVPPTARNPRVKKEKKAVKQEEGAEESDTDTSTETDVDEPPDGAIVIKKNRSGSMASSASSMGGCTPMSLTATPVFHSKPQLAPNQSSGDVSMAGTTPGMVATTASGNFNFSFD